MKLTRKLLAVSAFGALALGGVSAPADAAPCYTPDRVLASNAGVTENGYVYWRNNRSGSYNILVSDRRDGRNGHFYVQYLKHNVGWVDRLHVVIPDGTSRRINWSFSKPYQVDKIGFGVARSGQYNYQIRWDNNRPCGA